MLVEQATPVAHAPFYTDLTGSVESLPKHQALGVDIYTALPYSSDMLYEFLELQPFDAIRDEIFSDDELQAFQWYLCQNPEAGDVIPETGGCRKIRWHCQGKGKRGGARIIYFLRNKAGQIRADCRLFEKRTRRCSPTMVAASQGEFR